MLQGRPLLLIAVSFIGGLLLRALLGAPLWLAAVALCIGCALLLGRRFPAAMGLVMIGLSLGVARYAVFTQLPASDLSRMISPAPVTVTGVVESDPEQHPGRLTFLLDSRAVDARNGIVPVSGTSYVILGPYARDGAGLIEEGDTVQIDGILQQPEAATNPGGFSWRDYLARRAVWSELRVRRPDAVRRAGESSFGNAWLRAAWHARARLLSAMRAGLSPPDSAVLGGVLLGRRIDLSPDVMAAFVSTGTVHILATAGLHVGIFCMLLTWLFARITLPRKLSAFLMIVLIWLYAFMAGGRPSVTRAALMASLYLGAVLFGRAPDLATSLGAAALVVLWLQPTAILEPAFQMSFATVLGVILLMPIWDELWSDRIKALRRRGPRKIAGWAAELVGLSLIAQLAAAPVVAQAYNQFSVLGFFANICVVPALFVLLPVGFIAALAGSACPAVGNVLFRFLVAPVLHYIVGCVTFFAGLPGCSLSVGTLPIFVLLAYYGALYGATLTLAALVHSRRRFAASGADTSAGTHPAKEPSAAHDRA